MSGKGKGGTQEEERQWQDEDDIFSFFFKTPKKEKREQEYTDLKTTDIQVLTDDEDCEVKAGFSMNRVDRVQLAQVHRARMAQEPGLDWRCPLPNFPKFYICTELLHSGETCAQVRERGWPRGVTCPKCHFNEPVTLADTLSRR